MFPRFSALRCAIPLALLAGCGGGHKVSDPVKPPQVHSEDAGPSGIANDAGTALPSALNEEDCEALFEHVFALAFTRQRAGANAEEQANEADLAKAKAKVRDELFAQCIGADREGFRYDCAMAAETVAALQTCMQP